MVGKDTGTNRYRRSKGNISVRKGRSRKNMFRLLLGFTLRMVLIALIVIAADRLWGYVNESDTFRIETVSFSGLERVQKKELERAVGEVRGQSIFKADLPGLASMIATHPWIKKAVVYRTLPDRLDIKITERIPAALAGLGKGMKLVDTEGVIIQNAEKGEFSRLPLLTGLEDADSGTGIASATGAVALLSEKEPGLLHRIERIDLSEKDKLIISLRGFDGKIYLNREDNVRNITNYMAIEHLIRKRYTSIEYVDLRWKRQISVKQGTPNG